MRMKERLSDCRAGEDFTVWGIRLEESLGHRLLALGIVPGCRIRVLFKKRAGTMVIRCRGARYALGAESAKGIVGGKTI